MPQQEPVRDLVDFFDHWQSERNRIVRLIEKPVITPNEKKTLELMLFVLDRVGPDDLKSEPN
ncbi:hypothetical protein [Halocynthiibacter styelae]|uniref:Uncharacterized protein n=1 Tax=Halocynthiibacter styelae TaxID=2761955 RepID=A0A8J7IEP3_9RHOB|nr:hypothetical protein [Paenihalocynthiibacter styelae]MBI1495029.1 hypothetical protein [Paenihalocynthiibacter styelae]